jgi:heat shock protein HslJ
MRGSCSVSLMIAMVLVVVGCGSVASGDGAPGPGLTGTSWRLVAVNGAPVPPGPDVTLRFTTDGVAGEAPCNSFSGSAAQDVERGRLEFSRVASTKRACVDPARGALETTWFNALHGEVLARLEGDARLELTADGVELSLDRVR